MVKLITSLELTVPFRPTQIPTGGGAEQVSAWNALTRSLANITNGLSDMADKAAIQEGKLAGAQEASLAALPQGVVMSGKASAGPAVIPNMPMPKGLAKERRQKAMAFYQAQGWSKEQAAGIVGNLLQESGLNSAITGDHSIPGASVGIGQWNRDRQANLKAFARERKTHWTDFDTQLAFVQHELTTSEKSAGEKLRSAKTIDEATAAMIGFERPMGWTPNNPRGGHGWKNRLAYAQQVFGLSPIAAGAAPNEPAASAPAATGSVAAGAPQPAAAVSDGAPFRLTRSWTLRGQAHDTAALNIMADRLEADALGKFEQIAAAAGKDPAAVQQGFEEYRKSVIGQLPIEMQPGFNAMVARNSISYVRQAAREHEVELQNEAEASFLTAYSAKRRNVVQMATRLGTDEQGSEVLAAELANLDSFIATAQGLTPQERAKFTAELRDDVVSAQILGQFENTPDAGARSTFAKTLEESWKSGKGPAKDLSPEAYGRISTQMTSILARDETARLKEANQIERQVNAIMSRVKAGYPIPEAERASIRAQVAALNDPELTQQFAFFDKLANWQTANRHATPEQIGAQIAAYENEIATRGATANDVTALEAMRDKKAAGDKAQQALAAEQQKAVTAATKDVDSLLKRVKDGFTLPAAEQDAVRSQVQKLGDTQLTKQMQLVDMLSAWRQNNRNAPPEIVARQADALQMELNKRGATPEEATALDAMRSLQKAALDGLEKDPLGWAQQAGRIQVENLNFTDQASMELSLRARAADATAVAQSYGRPVRFFRPEERDALARRMAEDPALMVGFVQTLRNSLGEKDAPKALAEISKEAPVLAHVAGLSMMTGENAIMKETATALKVRQIDNYQPVNMPQSQRPTVAALAFLPGLEASATKTAELLFDIRARQAGLDPVKDPETAQTLWTNTMSEVLGARTINGEIYGGLADVNGRMTIVPTDMTGDQLQARMDAINDATLADLPPIKTLNGYKITADELATAKLVPVAPNKYRVALGDPASDDPRYLMGEDNSFWILDIGMLPAAEKKPTTMSWGAYVR